MMGQETRNKLTDYWKDHEIKEGEEFAILTNVIQQGMGRRDRAGAQKAKGLEKSKFARSHERG